MESKFNEQRQLEKEVATLVGINQSLDNVVIAD